MDSQTEQSDSTLPETQQQQQQPEETQPPSEETPPLEAQPQPDLSPNEAPTPEDSENTVKADEADTESNIEEGQEELEEAVEAAEAEEVEAPTEAEPVEIEAIGYGNLQDVASALDSMAPEIRSHVEPVMNLVKSAHVDYKVAVSKYEDARAELQAFAAEMKDYGVESEEVVQRFESQQKQIRELNNACVDTTWRAFSRFHPEFAGQTQKTKTIFSDIVGSMLDQFPGDSTLDKLEEAYKYALYTTGATAEKAPKAEVKKEAPSKPAPEKAAPAVNVNSKQQALVTDGATPLSNPVLDVDDLSWNEILNRHLHLL